MPEIRRFYKPLRELTALGWVGLTVFVGKALSEFVVPSAITEFRFFALLGAIIGLSLANLLNISRRALLVLLAVCLLVGWGTTAWFHILLGTGAEAGVGLYLMLSLLLVAAFISFGAALRIAGLASEKSTQSDEEGSESQS